jgi:GR25 family glycosyltransferase involved in LPS biosynthesis
MKVLYINLDRRPERRIHIEKELSRAGIEDENKERIRAVDGRTLDLNCPRIRSLFSVQVLKEAEEEGVPFIPGSRMTRGGLGCALSHHKAYLHILSSSFSSRNNNNDCGVLVLEDDVYLADHFIEKAEALIATAPMDYDVLYLGYHESWASTPVSKTWIRPTEQVFGTFALWIRLHSVERILQSLFPVTAQLDSEYSRNLHRLRIYLPTPEKCIVWPVNSMESDIQMLVSPTPTPQNDCKSGASALLILVFIIILLIMIVVMILLIYQ